MDMEKGRAGVVLLFPFFVIKEGLWSETGRKKAQKKIIPAVPFAFIISLACLTASNRILSSFRSAGNGPHTIQPVLPIIHLFCHILGTHPLTFVSQTQAHALYLLRMMLASRCIFDVCKRFIAFLEERIPRFAAEVKHKCIKIHEVLCILT